MGKTKKTIITFSPSISSSSFFLSLSLNPILFLLTFSSLPFPLYLFLFTFSSLPFPLYLFLFTFTFFLLIFTFYLFLSRFVTMYGMINIAIEEHIRSKYGNTVWKHIMKKVKKQTGEEKFAMFQTYNDDVTYGLVKREII